MKRRRPDAEQSAERSTHASDGSKSASRNALLRKEIEQLKKKLKSMVKEKEIEQLKKKFELKSMVKEKEQIKKELESTNIIVVRELLDSRLAPFTDLSDSKMSTGSCTLSTPNKVENWSGFEDDVKAHRVSLGHALLHTKIERVVPINPKDSKAGDQRGLVNMFNSNVLMGMNRLPTLVEKNIRLDRVADSMIEMGVGPRTSDLLCHQERSDGKGHKSYSIGRSGKTVTVLVTMEAKQKNLTAKSTTDLVNRFKQGDHVVVTLVGQVVHYMIKTSTQFGIITTYENTWAAQLSSTGTLKISKAVSCETNGANSVVNTIHYVALLADENMNTGWLPPKLTTTVHKGDSEGQVSGGAGRSQSVQRKERTRGQTASKQSKLPIAKTTAKKQSCSEIPDNIKPMELLSVLVEHDDRITWQARMHYHGASTVVAVKGFELKEDRDREVACYAALKQLQGVSVPKLLIADYDVTVLWEERRVYGIVTSWVGKVDGGIYMRLPTDALQNARRVVCEVHRCGVVHGDVRPENMKYDFGTGKLFLLDFGNASTKAMLGRQRFQQACKEEVKDLDFQIECSKTEVARSILYLVD